jgi:hypothetical protein
MKVEQSDINEFLIEIQVNDEARLFIDRQHHPVCALSDWPPGRQP